MKIKKNTIIIGLIALNIAVVLFFLLNQPPRPPHEPKKMIIEKLSLDKNQIIAFESLIKKHKKESRLMHDQIREAKKTTYQKALLDEKDIDSLLNDLSQKLIAVDKRNIEHLLEIKEMLHEDQLDAFEDLLKNIDRTFQPGPPRPIKH
jgi:Spy/CpxP family protein refolding chaperone